MGTGIAIVAARHVGADVTVLDSSLEMLKKSEQFVQSWVAKEVKKEKMTAVEGEAVAGRIVYGTMDSCADRLANIEFVIEAVTERLEVKQAVFRELDAKCNPKAILATNTSSISITKIAAVTNRADQVVGMHFMNPVPVMKGLELISGLATTDETMATTVALGFAMKKDPSVCKKDVPGFLVNRVLMPMINEAIIALDEGVMTKEDLDKAMKLSAGFPMGPLTLADFIGLDTCLSIMQVLHKELGDSKYRPSPLLVNYVDAGYLGKKTGRGFYQY